MEVSLMDLNRSKLLLQTCTVSALALVLVAASGAGVLAQEQAGSPFGLGRTPTPAELLAWDISIGPAGDELPEGSGSVGEGAGVYSQRGCSECHGPTGVEGPALVLVGGEVSRRTNYFPLAYWPFATSIWDYIRRAMPYHRPGHLTANEVYALTAFLLNRNDIIEANAVMDKESLPKVVMPHRDDYVIPVAWEPGTPRGFKRQP